METTKSNVSDNVFYDSICEILQKYGIENRDLSIELCKSQVYYMQEWLIVSRYNGVETVIEQLNNVNFNPINTKFVSTKVDNQQ